MRYEVSTHEIFDEMKYLIANPDVVQAIERKEFKNGHEYFEINGFIEKRYQKVSLERFANRCGSCSVVCRNVITNRNRSHFPKHV